MTKEQEEAIEYLKKYIKWETYGERNLEKDIITILNLVDKLQKENEELVETYKSEKKMKIKYVNLYQDLFLKENVIPVQKVKDIIDRIDYDIKKTKEIISKNTNDCTSNRKNDYQIVRLKAMNTKSLDIKKRLQKLLESEE